MKYVDKKFISYKEKKSEEDFPIKSDRALKRERQRKFYLFYTKYLSKNVDKLWWNNLSDSDKKNIINNFNIQSDFMKNKKENLWYSSTVFENWEEWFNYIKSEYKPNKSNLRNDRLKLLGI